MELCNGAFENCSDPLIGFQDSPSDETDDDGDCYVECSGFDSNTWEGGIHACEYIDGNGSPLVETVVVGGDDCQDNDENTFPGAAILNPTVCAQDLDQDGQPTVICQGSIQVTLAKWGYSLHWVLVQILS